MNTQKRSMNAGRVILAVVVLSGALVRAQTVFESTFTGPDGAAISSLSQWQDSNTYAGSTKTLQGNQAQFTTDGSNWLYPSVRANTVLNPMTGTGLRFEGIVNKIQDNGTSNTENGSLYFYLSDRADWSQASCYIPGEKICLRTAVRNKSTGAVDISLDFVNNQTGEWHPWGTDMGGSVWLAQETLNLAGGDRVAFSVELRNDPAGADVRGGYRVYRTSTGAWSGWVYSDWFNPTIIPPTPNPDNTSQLNYHAFASDWKTRWANTSLYLEAYAPMLRVSRIWVDDVYASTLGTRVYGDVDGNGVVDATDINLVQKNIGTTKFIYDVNYDGAVDQNDVDHLVHRILKTEYGDANLDGKVNGSDVSLVDANYGQIAGANWSTGDFNADGQVDAADLDILADHYGFGTAPSVNVFSDNTSAVYLTYGSLPNPSGQVTQAIDDFKRGYKAMTGQDVPRTPATGRIPLRLTFAFYNPGQTDYHTDVSNCQDYTIAVTTSSITLTAKHQVGMSNAIYDLLHRWGCRWVYPGDTGEAIPTVRHLELPIGTFNVHISMDPNTSYGSFYGPWLARNRMAGMYWLTAQHYWLYAIPPETYFATHPEYYALIGGQRTPTQLCVSNPTVVQMMKDYSRQFFMDGTSRASFPMDPADNIDHCQCANCQAMDAPAVPGLPVSMTDRVAAFSNAVAQARESDFPNRLIGFYAYSTHQALPVNVTLHRNILIGLTRMNACLIHLSPTASCASSTSWWTLLDGWKQLCPNHLYTYEYVPLYWTGGLTSPVYLEHGHSIKEQVSRGVRGMWTEGGTNWSVPNYVNYYLDYNLKADASLLPEDLLSDMCYSFFGPAGKVMNDYYLTLAQSTAFTHPNRVEVDGSIEGFDELFTASQIASARSSLNRAIQVASSDPVLQHRVNLIDLSQQYLENYLNMIWSAKAGDYNGVLTNYSKVSTSINALDAVALDGIPNPDNGTIAVYQQIAADARTRMNTAKLKAIAQYFPDQLGMIRSWQLLGPLNNDTRDADFAPEIFPTAVFPSGVTVGQPTHLADGSTVNWQVYISPQGQVDFDGAFTGSRAWLYSAAYAAVKVTNPTARTVQFRMDSFFPFRVYLNGSGVYYRAGLDADCPDKRIANVSLPAGTSVIILKSSETTNPSYAFRWGFYFRITDTSGNVIPGLTTSTAF